MVKNCPFCSISENRAQEEIVWEDKDFIAFLDKKPIKPGHILIIPRKHVKFLFDLDYNTYIKLMTIARKLSDPLIKAMKSKTAGILLSGFEVLHVHLHVVPRNEPGEFMGNPKEASREELHRVAEKIRAEIRKMKL
jgi:histidine triad (HIT) family protein